MRNKLFADTAHFDESDDIMFTDAMRMCAASFMYALTNLSEKKRELRCTEACCFLIVLVRLKVFIKRNCITLIVTAG